jgi:thiol-disulfide isomerase/thioredoxin
MGHRSRIIAAGLLALSASLAHAQAPATDDAAAAKQPAKESPSLKVGDKAPALSLDKWIKGEPITGFEKGRTYVVEFWATWCGPCIESMPHLSALQKQYKDKGVTIVGVSTRDSRGNTLDAAEKMVADKGDVMGYTVAWDKGRETYESYMKAAKQNGIPCSFVVDGTGTVVYIGHPMWLDTVIEKTTKGTWNATSGPKEIEEAQARFEKAATNIETDPKAALVDLDALAKENPALVPMIDGMRYNVLLKQGDPEASKVGRRMAETAIEHKDAVKLNEIAWGIVDPEAKVQKKDLDLAYFAASKAVEITHSKDGAILDTLARVYFCKGDVAKAIELEEKAIEIAPDAIKSDLEEALSEYKKAKK